MFPATTSYRKGKEEVQEGEEAGQEGQRKEASTGSAKPGQVGSTDPTRLKKSDAKGRRRYGGLYGGLLHRRDSGRSGLCRPSQGSY